MGRIFNVSAACIPELHYMVNMDEKLNQIKSMVDKGLYFTINRARQYGKTTTLHALERLLQKEYIVISLDFQTFSAADFQTEKDFVENFCTEILGSVSSNSISPIIRGQLEQMANNSVPNDRLSILFRCLSKWCGLSAPPITRYLLIFLRNCGDIISAETKNQSLNPLFWPECMILKT